MNSNLAHDWAADGYGGYPSLPARTDRHITVVPTKMQKRSRPRAVYALITAGGLFLVIVGQLLLSVATSEAAYQISSLETTHTALARTEQTLALELDAMASPQNLAANAEALGMVRNTNPSVFLRLSDGTVLGHPAAATATASSIIGAGGLVPNAVLAAERAAPAGAAASAASTKSDVVAHAQASGITAHGPKVEKTRAPDAARGTANVPLEGGLSSPTTR